MTIDTAQSPDVQTIKPADKPVGAATSRLQALIEERDSIQVQIDGLQAKNGLVQKFLDSLDGQIGPYAMQQPDVYAVLIGLWEDFKASNPG